MNAATAARRPPSRALVAASALVGVAALVTAALGVTGGRDAAAASDPVAPAAGPLEVAVIGDYGVDTAAEGQVASMVAGWSPDMVVTVGDNYYTTGSETGTARYDRVVGKYYCAFLAGAAAGTNCPSGGTSATNRFFPATGNHDYTDGGIANYQAYFNLPGAGVTSQAASGSELYYDVRNGSLHLFFIDSQAALGSATSMSTQKAWLQAALGASDAPWKVVVLHHPPLSSSSTHGSSTGMQWPYATWGADLVLTGHDHTWERVESGGITYAVNGLGGAGRYAFSSTPVAGSVARYNANWGALRLSIDATTLTGEFLAVDGTLADRFALTTDGTTARLQDGVSPAAYGGTRDATISQAAPTTALGTATTLLLDGDDPPGSGSDLSTVLRFDTSSIPAGATVVDASVRFRATDPSASVYRAYPLLRSWTETVTTWTTAATGVPWATAGATGATDRGSTAVGVLSAPSLGRVTLALDANGIALVQSWIDGTATNNGIVIAGTSVTDGIDLASREATTAGDRPELVVTYRLGTAPPLAVTTASLPGATVGVPYSTTLTAGGGTPPYTWAVTSGSLPATVTLGPDGTLSGAPGTAGSFPFTATVTDSLSATASASLALVVTAPAGPGAFAKSSPANGATGVRGPVTLKWGTSSGATGYAVCVDTDADSTCDSGWTSTGTSRSFKRSLAAFTTYRWQVRATNAAGGVTLANGGTWWQFRSR